MKLNHEKHEEVKLPEIEVQPEESNMSIEVQIDLLAEIILSQILNEL